IRIDAIPPDRRSGRRLDLRRNLYEPTRLRAARPLGESGRRRGRITPPPDDPSRGGCPRQSQLPRATENAAEDRDARRRQARARARRRGLAGAACDSTRGGAAAREGRDQKRLERELVPPPVRVTRLKSRRGRTTKARRPPSFLGSPHARRLPAGFGDL